MCMKSYFVIRTMRFMKSLLFRNQFLDVHAPDAACHQVGKEEKADTQQCNRYGNRQRREGDAEAAYADVPQHHGKHPAGEPQTESGTDSRANESKQQEAHRELQPQTAHAELSFSRVVSLLLRPLRKTPSVSFRKERHFLE